MSLWFQETRISDINFHVQMYFRASNFFSSHSSLLWLYRVRHFTSFSEGSLIVPSFHRELLPMFQTVISFPRGINYNPVRTQPHRMFFFKLLLISPIASAFRLAGFSDDERKA